MTIQDLIITPIYIVLFTVLAYFIRPYVTNQQTRKYFLPALWVRFGGAIALGLIYQFYYDGGDTFNYFTHGSRWIWEAFHEDVELGLKMLWANGGDRILNETYAYSSRIWYYRDPHSYMLVRIAAFFDLFTLHTYSATALFFAVFSFSGLWAMFEVVSSRYQQSANRVGLVILFIPSVIFWGSGILKDTITLGALGWLTWGLYRIIEMKYYRWIEILVIGFSSLVIYKIKSYVLISFLPLVAFWLLLKNLKKIKNSVLRFAAAPFLMLVFGGVGILLLNNITANTNKYKLETIAERARITAYDIRYGWGARSGGDGGYDIGLPDGTLIGMAKLIPAALNVSLFRPYLWEVKNPLMLLSALEAVFIGILALKFFFNRGLRSLTDDPFLLFSLVFSLIFSFAVGVSTFNFGTLIRYKIVMMPFLLLALTVKKEGNYSDQNVR